MYHIRQRQEIKDILYVEIITMHTKVKTINRMRHAFLSLLEEKEYLDISVSDIVRKAGVARASFYRRYKSIDDLANDVVQNLKKTLGDDFFPTLRSKDESAIKTMLSRMLENIRANDIHLVRIRPSNQHVLLWKLDRDELFRQRGITSSIHQRYDIPLILLAIFTIATAWAYFGYVDSLQDVTNYAYARIKPLLDEHWEP